MTSEFNPIRYRLAQAQGLVDNINLVRNNEIIRDDHILYNVSPTEKTVQSILPDADFIYANIDNNVYITATPGEYEPASLAIEAFANLDNLSVSVSNLNRNGGGTIPSSNIDISVVKCWYQSGSDTIGYLGQKILVPELLLKDDSLISVDYLAKENYAKINGNYVWISDPTKRTSAYLPENSVFPIEDSSTLQPIDISDSQFRQFWLTVKVPEDASGGEYTGDLTLNASNGMIGKYKITVNVLPFKLEDSLLKYSLYYGGRTQSSGIGTISSKYKTTQQYSAEISDILKHGVSNVTMAQSYANATLLDNELALRTSLGMSTNSLYFEGLGTGNSTDPNDLLSLKSKVSDIVYLAGNYGITNTYIYGIDEATNDDLLKQREAWEAVHEARGKIFVAGKAGSLAKEYPWGKIGNWHLDETEGTSTVDLAENGNNGTLVNMSAASWGTGKVGNALTFDGIDDYVLIGDVCNMGQSDFTLSAWIKSTSTEYGNSNGIIYKRGTVSYASAGYRLNMPYGAFNFHIADGVNYKSLYAGSYGQYNDGAWHHVVAVAERGSKLSIYIDGVLKASTSETNVGNIDSTVPLSIGALSTSPGSHYHEFDGQIDEVRIFSRALREDEIEKEYLYGVQGKRQTVGDLKDLHVCAFGLSKDEVEKSHEVSGHEIFSYANPQIGIENPEIYRRNYGLQLWKYGYDGSMDFAYQWSMGDIWNDFDHSTYRDHNFTYPTVNGIIDTIAWEGFREGIDDTRYMATLLKAIDEASSSQLKTDAVNFVDNLKETDRLDVEDLVVLRKYIIYYITNLLGPVGNWHFDEGTGTVTNDSSGSNAGTLTNMDPQTCWVSGQFGNALLFDGVDDYVYIGNVCNMDQNDFSISAWVKSTSTLIGNNNDIVYKRGTGSYAGAGYRLSMPNGQFNFHIADGTNYKSLYAGASGQYNDNNWHHVVAVAERGSALYIYVDGVLKASTSETNVSNIDSTVPLAIGALATGSTYHHFDGQIDEVKIFSRALSESEIQRECQGWD
jgi:hypothetical protein